MATAWCVDPDDMSFSWIVNDSDSNEMQTAYRIIVSGTAALEGDVYDSQWIDSDISAGVQLDDLSKQLKNNELYYWQVQTKDSQGATSPLSEAIPFMTDIGTDWQSLDGIWATPVEVTKTSNKSSSSEADDENDISRYSFFRSPNLNIVDTDLIDRAIVSASSRGTSEDRCMIFDLFMNGSNIGAGAARECEHTGTGNGTADYTQVYYNSYDVTNLLTDGNNNVISAVGCCRNAMHGILVQMTVFYKDGTKEIITNSGTEDSGWKTLDGTLAFGDDGSDIDTGNIKIPHDNINMNYYPVGFSGVNYDDSEWKSAEISAAIADSTDGTSGRVLCPAASENVIRVLSDDSAKNVYENSAGNIVIDLGKEIIGGVSVNLNCDTDADVTIHRGEEMNDDGSVCYQLTAGPIYEDNWHLVKGSNIFQTETMRNFRYIELIGLTNAIKAEILESPDCIKGWAMQKEFDDSASDYYASDGSDEATLMNRLWDLCKYTVDATSQDVCVDSQARERLPYEGDLLVNSFADYSVENNYALIRHSEEWLIDNPTWPNDYHLFSVEMAYWDYMYTGDDRLIAEYYTALKNKLSGTAYVIDQKTGFIRGQEDKTNGTALIDWPTSERDGYQEGFYDVILNVEYAGIYERMAEISQILGYKYDAQQYKSEAQKLKASLIQYAWDEENGCFYDSLSQDYTATQHSSVHATAYALAYGIFSDQSMADRMCEFVYAKCKDQFTGSIYASYFILRGLYNGNHGELAEKLLTNPTVGTDVKTYASILDDLECTITPEAWGHGWKNNMTLSHPWGTAPVCAIVQGTFGIMPEDAGFSVFSIKLQPGDISSASLRTSTVKGIIEVSYKNADTEGINELKMTTELTIPANSQANVYIPAPSQDYHYLLVNGTRTEADNDGTYMRITLGSGNYQISVSLN